MIPYIFDSINRNSCENEIEVLNRFCCHQQQFVFNSLFDACLSNTMQINQIQHSRYPSTFSFMYLE